MPTNISQKKTHKQWSVFRLDKMNFQVCIPRENYPYELFNEWEILLQTKILFRCILEDKNCWSPFVERGVPTYFFTDDKGQTTSNNIPKRRLNHGAEKFSHFSHCDSFLSVSHHSKIFFVLQQNSSDVRQYFVSLPAVIKYV